MKKSMIVIAATMLTGFLAFGQTDKPAVAEKAVKEAKVQTTCPVDDAKIDKTVFVDVKGIRIFLCCSECVGRCKANPDKYECYRNFCRDGCRDKVKADPDKYIAQMEDQGIVLEKVPEAKVAEARK